MSFFNENHRVDIFPVSTSTTRLLSEVDHPVRHINVQNKHDSGKIDVSAERRRREYQPPNLKLALQPFVLSIRIGVIVPQAELPRKVLT